LKNSYRWNLQKSPYKQETYTENRCDELGPTDWKYKKNNQNIKIKSERKEKLRLICIFFKKKK